MTCKKCGSKIDPSWRCCLNCGELNPIHPKNATILNEFGNEDVEYLSEIEDTTRKVNNKAFLTVNIIVGVIYTALIIALICAVIGYSDDLVNKNVAMIVGALIGLIIAGFSIFYGVCRQKILIKANLPWWGVFVPLYNSYLWYKTAYKKKGLSILMTLFPMIILLVSLVLICVAFSTGLNKATGSFALVAMLVIICLGALMYKGLTVVTMVFVEKRFGFDVGVAILLALFLSFVIEPMIALSKKRKYVG